MTRNPGRILKRGILIFGMAMLLFIARRDIIKAESTKKTTAVEAVVVSEKSWEQMERRAQAQEEERTLVWGGEALPAWRGEHTFYFPVTEEQLEDGIALSGFAGANGERVLFREFPKTEELGDAVASGREWPLLMEKDGKVEEYALVFTGMPILELSDTGEMDGAFDKVQVRLFQGSFGDGSVKKMAGKIRIRGALSKEFPKVGYRLKLEIEDGFGHSKERAESLLGMRKSASWNLAALYADDLKIRDKLSVDLWNQLIDEREAYGFDAAFGTRMEYVEVIRNGEYLGVYGLMEPIDGEQLGITDSAGGAGLSEYYYKKQNDVIAPEEAFMFSAEDQVIPKTETEEETENSVNYVASLEIKDAAGKPTAQAWEPIRQYMGMMRLQAYEELAPSLLDLDNTADMWCFLQVIAGVDNDVKNLYYAAKLVDGAYRIYFVPWDMDMSWGNEYCEESPTYQSYYTLPADTIIEWNPGTPLLAADAAGFRGRVKERWQKLRETIFSEEAICGAEKEACSYVKSSGAYARDAKRWPQSPHSADDRQFRQFVHQRLELLDAYVEEWQ